MTPERAREILADELEKSGAWGLAAEVRAGTDNRFGECAALRAITRAVAEATRASQPKVTPAPLTLDELHGAVARGWCHFKNKHKEMDRDLAEAVTAEVWLAIASDQRVDQTPVVGPQQPVFSEDGVSASDVLEGEDGLAFALQQKDRAERADKAEIIIRMLEAAIGELLR